MRYLQKAKEWRERKRKQKEYRRKKRRGQHKCRHSKEADGLCPHWIEYGIGTNGLGVQVHGLHRCCAIRMGQAKAGYAIVHGHLNATPELRRQCKEALGRYKEEFPEEYYEVFGEDESIGYHPHNIDG